MISAVSHEMIAPLNSTITVGETLLESITDEEHLKMVKMVITLNRMVMCQTNDLLDSNMLEHSKLIVSLG